MFFLNYSGICKHNIHKFQFFKINKILVHRPTPPAIHLNIIPTVWQPHCFHCVYRRGSRSLAWPGLLAFSSLSTTFHSVHGSNWGKIGFV